MSYKQLRSAQCNCKLHTRRTDGRGQITEPTGTPKMPQTPSPHRGVEGCCCWVLQVTSGLIGRIIRWGPSEDNCESPPCIEPVTTPSLAGPCEGKREGRLESIVLCSRWWRLQTSVYLASDEFHKASEVGSFVKADQKDSDGYHTTNPALLSAGGGGDESREHALTKAPLCPPAAAFRVLLTAAHEATHEGSNLLDYAQGGARVPLHRR